MDHDDNYREGPKGRAPWRRRANKRKREGLPEPVPIGEDLEKRILFVDAEVLVLDKPAGLPVDTPRSGGTSLEARIHELSLGFQRPPTAMHRLDRDTSGVLLLARTPRARKVVQAAFEARMVEKIYWAVLDGEVEGGEGEINLPLSKVSSQKKGWRMVGDARAGQSAITGWRVLARHEGQTLVEFKPQTGRTHQLRVHAAEGLGAAVVGDPVYGEEGPAMLLHARRLIVPRDPHEAVDVTAPLPDTFPDWCHEPG